MASIDCENRTTLLASKQSEQEAEEMGLFRGEKGGQYLGFLGLFWRFGPFSQISVLTSLRDGNWHDNGDG